MARGVGGSPSGEVPGGEGGGGSEGPVRGWTLEITRRPGRRRLRGPFHRVVDRWRRRRQRDGERAVDTVGNLDTVDAVGCADDLFVGIGIAVALAVVVFLAIWLGPLLVVAVFGVLEFVVLALLALGGGFWAWVRRRPKLLVATGPDGRRWVRPAELGSAAQDADALAAGLAPELLGYAPHQP